MPVPAALDCGSWRKFKDEDMPLVRSLKCMLFFTFLALVYIYMQMNIYELAYQGKQKERIFLNLKEYNTMINYRILRLKSAHHLGDTLLAKDSDLRFRDQQQTVRLAKRSDDLDNGVTNVHSSDNSFLQRLLSLLTLSEARAESQKKSLNPWKKFQ